MDGDKTVLLVEDNPEDIFLIQRAFKAAGITKDLIILNDGEAALAYLRGAGAYSDRKKHPLPDLMLLDLDMPKLNGFQVLHWLRAQGGLRQLPVIVLTMSVYHSDIQTAYLLGANSFLSKPVDFLDLAAAVRQMCEFWLGPCELPEINPIRDGDEARPPRSNDHLGADDKAAAA